jgi:peptidylprolyl isomerase
MSSTSGRNGLDKLGWQSGLAGGNLPLMQTLFLAALLAASTLPLLARTVPVATAAAAPGPGDVIAAAPAGDWEAVDDGNVLLLEFAGGRTLIIQLANAYAPGHVANIHALVRDGWLPKHAAIVRVQENYVVQWGDPTEKAALPGGIEPRPEGGYERPGPPAEFRALPFKDAYGATVGHAKGWPVATDGTAHWLPHCPGMVGVGRNMPPDTGTGAELYVVIGHGPRHLDRNIALVGRVLAGMEGLSALPRGTGALGFYEKPDQRVKVVSARLAVDLAAAVRPRFEVLRSESASFAKWVEARANRRDGFFVRPAGGADICNLMPPVRSAPQAK